MQTRQILSWVLSIAAAAILLQTLFFKFTGHAESVDLFTKLGVEPWGRIGTGVIELVVAILLLWPSTRSLGALGALGVMSGAIGSHLLVLGIESAGDGGFLFTLAWVVFALSAVILWLHKAQLLQYIQWLRT
jgi:uncharacterized membrane protein YphA (DoxX/SURF4 family)